MKCRHCNALVAEGFRFCTECGAPMELADQEEKTRTDGEPFLDALDKSTDPICTEEPDEKQKKKGFKKKPSLRKTGVIAVCAILLAAIGGGVYFWFVADVPRRYEEQLKLGARYLTEGKYEEAVAALEKAIKLDAKQPEPEILLAEAYTAMGKQEEALAALENADQKLSNIEDKKEVRRLSRLIRQGAMKLVPLFENPSDFLMEKSGIHISIDEVITAAFPEVQLIVAYDGMPDKPNRGSFIIKEQGNRRQVTDVKDVGKNTVIVTYKTEISSGESGQERHVSAAYKNNKSEIVAEDSYVTPEVKDAVITLEQVDARAYPVIKLYYRVEDPHTGDAVDELTLEDFTLSELSAGLLLTREIKNFTQLEGSAGLNVEIVADISGSMDGSKLDTLKEVINSFAGSLHYEVGDKMEITAFDDSIYQICGFTSDIQLIEQSVNSMETAGSTAFYDAVIAASNRVMMQSGARCLIAFTDGGDNASRNSVEEATLYAKKYSLPLFIIGIGSGINEELLKQMAEQTGGFYRHVDEINDLSKIYKKIYEGRKKLYMLEYETTSDKVQSEKRDISLELSAKGRYRGSISNSYVPQIATEGETMIDIINLQQQLANELAITGEDKNKVSNIKIDYSKVKGFTKAEQFTEYLEGLITAMGTEKPNDLAKADIAAYIEYAIGQSVKGELKSEKNQVLLSAQSVGPVFENAEKVKNLFEQLLADYNIYLNKKIKISAVADVLGLNKKKTVQMILDETLPGAMGEDDELLILMGSSKQTVKVTARNLLEILNKGNCTVQMKYVKGGAEIAFANEKGKAVKKLSESITFGLPAESAVSTVFASYSEGSDNWGGQYSPENKSIEFSTAFAGEYNVLENEIKITDMGELTREQQRAVTFMVSKGYFATDGDKFRPAESLVRYEFTEALVKMFFALDRSLKTDFTDMVSEDPYYALVASAQKDNIVEGYPDQTFKGENTITGEQVIALCARTLAEKKGYSYPVDPDQYLTFEDADSVSKWAGDAVALAVREGLIPAAGQVNPKGEISRAASADILYNLFMRLYDTPPVALSSSDVPATEGAIEADNKESRSFSGAVPIALGATALAAAGAVVFITLRRRKSKEAYVSLAPEWEAEEEFDYDSLPPVNLNEAAGDASEETEVH